MKCLIVVLSDGTRTLAHIVPADFDTRAWAESRREALDYLRVVEIIEEYRVP